MSVACLKIGAVALLNGQTLGKEVAKLARSGPKTGEIIAKTIKVSGGQWHVKASLSVNDAFRRHQFLTDFDNSRVKSGFVLFLMLLT